MAGGAAPKANFDRLRLEHEEFRGSLSAIKRMVAAIVKERGVRADDVASPVDTLPGQVAQVGFGAVGKLWDPKEKRLRKSFGKVSTSNLSSSWRFPSRPRPHPHDSPATFKKSSTSHPPIPTLPTEDLIPS